MDKIRIKQNNRNEIRFDYTWFSHFQILIVISKSFIFQLFPNLILARFYESFFYQSFSEPYWSHVHTVELIQFMHGI